MMYTSTANQLKPEAKLRGSKAREITLCWGRRLKIACPSKGLLHVQWEYVLARVYCTYSENMSQQGSTACTVGICLSKGLLHVQ